MKLGARFYDPEIGRFINQDSYLGESSTPPSLHRYLYVYGNPTVNVDPDGYCIDGCVGEAWLIGLGLTAVSGVVLESDLDGNGKPLRQDFTESVASAYDSVKKDIYTKYLLAKGTYVVLNAMVNGETLSKRISVEDTSGVDLIEGFPVDPKPLPTLGGYGSNFDEKERRIPVFPANVPENVSPEGYGTENVNIGSIPPSSGGLTEDETKRLLHDPMLAEGSGNASKSQLLTKGLSKTPDGYTRVGRWMSETEYKLMKKTGRVQQGDGGLTFSAVDGPQSYIKETSMGNIYVEFDVPTNSLLRGGKDVWVKNIGPDAGFPMKRMLEKQGGEMLPQYKNLSEPLLKKK